MDREPIWRQLDQPDLFERADDVVEVLIKEVDRLPVVDVAGRDDEEAAGRSDLPKRC